MPNPSVPGLLGEYTSEQLQRGLRPMVELPRNSNFLVQCDGAIGYHGSLQGLQALIALATSDTITDGHPYPQIFLLPNLILIFGKTKIYEWVSVEFLSASGWTSTGWTGSWIAGWTHTIGNISVLSYPTAAVNGSKYHIAYTVTGRTAGSFTVAFGGQSLSGITATGEFFPVTTSTANLTITPTTDFDGMIVMSVKSVLVLKLTVTTGNPWSVVEYYDQLLMTNGVVTVERRAGDKVYAVRADLPVGEALFNFGGQIIVGGLTAGSLA